MAGQEFFTTGTLATLGGATIIIIVVTNTARALAGFRTPFIPFAVSLVVTFGAAANAGTLSNAMDWLLAFANACLLFCTATGAQTTMVAGSRGQLSGQLESQSDHPAPSWLSDWFRD